MSGGLASRIKCGATMGAALMKRALVLVALVLLAFAMALPLGCSQNPPASVDVAPASPPATAAGSYVAGDRLVLENGASITVPAGWNAKLLTSGALVSTPPADSGIIGGMMDVPTVPHWGTVTFSVYGPQAGFDANLADLERIYGLSRKPSAGARFSTVRVNMRLDAQTTATAFVVTYAGKKPRYDISVFVRGSGGKPLILTASMSSLPQGFGGAPPTEMPKLLLDYLQFRPR